MNGVTTAIVGFLLIALVFPGVIKSRTQYYAALAAVLLIIFLDALGVVTSGSLHAVAYFFGAILQIFAIVSLVMSAGGLTAGELGADMSRAFEVMRRGSEEKEVIIPLSGEAYRRREEAGIPPRRPAAGEADDDASAVTHTITDPAAPIPPAPPTTPTPPRPAAPPPGPIPLD